MRADTIMQGLQACRNAVPSEALKTYIYD